MSATVLTNTVALTTTAVRVDTDAIDYDVAAPFKITNNGPNVIRVGPSTITATSGGQRVHVGQVWSQVLKADSAQVWAVSTEGTSSAKTVQTAIFSDTLDTGFFLTRSDASGTYAPLAPASSADVTGATDNAGIALMLAAGLAVKLRPNTTYYANVVLDTGNDFEVPGSTTLVAPAGSNLPAIRTKNFENFAPGRLSAALAHGVAVTSIPCTPLTHAMVSGDTLKFGSEYTNQTATVGVAGAAVGATSIPVASFTPSGSDDFPIGMSIKLNVTDASGLPHGFRISIKGTVDGNKANNTAGNAVSLFGTGFQFDAPGVIYHGAELGFYSVGVKGSTAAYPGGQVETSIGVVRVAESALTNIRYEGPHDGHATMLISRDAGGAVTGNGIEYESLNAEYFHSYGKVQGVVAGAGGYGRVAHIESENNTHENFITASTLSTSENWIGRLTTYTGWTSGSGTTANSDVLVNNNTHIGKIDNRTTNAVSGVSVVGKGATIGGGRSLGSGTTGTTGLSVSADDVNIVMKVDGWYNGWQRFGKGGHFEITGANCTHFGYNDVDSTNNGSYVEFHYTKTGSETPWSGVPAAFNTYLLTCTDGSGNVVLNYERSAEGLDNRAVLKVLARDLTTGESSIPMELASGAIALTSQEVRFCAWTPAKTETINNIRGVTSTVAAGSTPSLVRFGIWSIDGTGAGTLAAACATDTTLMAAANTAYTRAAVTPYAKVAGTPLASGYLVVTAAALPTVPGANFNGPGSEGLILPWHSARLASQADLPSTFTYASLLTSGQRAYMAVTP